MRLLSAPSRLRTTQVFIRRKWHWQVRVAFAYRSVLGWAGWCGVGVAMLVRTKRHRSPTTCVLLISIFSRILCHSLSMKPTRHVLSDTCSVVTSSHTSASQVTVEVVEWSSRLKNSCSVRKKWFSFVTQDITSHRTYLSNDTKPILIKAFNGFSRVIKFNRCGHVVVVVLIGRCRLSSVTSNLSSGNIYQQTLMCQHRLTTSWHFFWQVTSHLLFWWRHDAMCFLLS